MSIEAGKEITMMIDGKPVVFVRKDSIASLSVRDIGTTRIIVADRGWVFVGNCEDNSDGSVTMRNTKNIRRWGTTRGLGQLVNGPIPDTKFDDYGEIRATPIIQINVLGGW